MSGRPFVYVVGAGPGDPGLLTRKGAEALARADAVVYDHLLDERILDLADPDAQRVDVAERSAADVHRLLVRLACDDGGRTVIRLKDGDPFVFSGAVEEAECLAEAGVPFEVVPGVTAGVAAPAFAGIPLVSRGTGPDVAFISGHPDVADKLPWEALARISTVCVFVAHKALAETCHRLMHHGRLASTPVALIREASTPRQETLVGTLHDIVDKARAAHFEKRYLMVVGEVVGLRGTLSWFETRPLFGKTVVVTRASAQASGLSDLLIEQGAEVLEFPVIKTVDPVSWEPVDAAIRELEGYDWVVFTSVNAVERFFERVEQTDRDARAFARSKVAAVGPATAARCLDHGIRPDYVPEKNIAEGLIEGFLERGVGEGTRVLLPRAQEAREVLPDTLRERGAIVDVVGVYRTVMGDGDADVLARIAEKSVDAVTFGSSSAVRNFIELTKRVEPGAIERLEVASIGPATSETARGLGLTVVAEADPHTMPALVSALLVHYAPSETGGCACDSSCDPTSCCGGAGH